MDFTREIVVPAALSEIFGRIFSLLIDNFLWPRSAGARDAHRRRLERLLFHISSMVEEAEGRDITNLQLLAHLKELIQGMYRGRFMLEVTDFDDVKNAAIGDDSVVATTGKRKFALGSPFNAAKRGRLIRAGGNGATTEKMLASVVEELESLTRDHMREFIQLVQGYPRRSEVHRPVTTTLYMDRCVFGRHVETERVVAFLLQRAPTTGLSALAVVGYGKTTLVRHVCHDNRVRGHFAHIEYFEIDDVLHAGEQPRQNEWTRGGAEYLIGVRRILDEPRFGAVGRSLLVFEDSWPVDESAWSTLLATSKLAEGSKLLLTCEDADLARTIGTAEPVVLLRLQEEEFWYYFKAFAFSGTDPRDHPRIAAVGREISRRLDRSFYVALVLGQLLRANFDARSWRRVLASFVKYRGLYPHVLDDLMSVRGWGYYYSVKEIKAKPTKLTLQDVRRAAATSSGSGLGGGDTEEAFTIHCSQGLYTDGWFTIIFKKRDKLRAAS